MRIRLRNRPSGGKSSFPVAASLPEGAYTLVEVMVASVIIAFVGTSLYGALAAGFCVMQSTRENLRATQIMMQKSEAIRLFTWDEICDTNLYLKPSFVEPYDPLGATNHSGGAQYTGFVTASVPAVGDVPEAYRTNMRTVTITVYWTNYNSARRIVHRREMQTRVARSGMQNYIWGAL